MNNSGEKTNFIAKHAKIAVIIAVICGACSGSLSAMTAIPAIGIGFWRLTIVLPFFLIPALTSSEKRAQLKAVSKSDWIWCCISGLFLFGHYFSWFNAVKMTNVASAAVLASFHPIVVLLVTVFIMKKKVGWKSVAAIFVALCGGAVVMGFDMAALTSGQMTGNILGLFAGIFMGLYFAVGGHVRKRVDGSIYVLLVFAACWVCFAVASAGTGTALLGYTFTDYLYVAIMAIVCQMGAHAVFNMCIGHVNPLYVSTWETADPVFCILIAVVTLGQIPKGYEIIGCIVVVAALLFYNYQESKES
ncbi:MAG: DMT family transporter [Firmicutes bacterium]|nr:DMT family transporter [Bacillota bacterium]